MRISRATKQEVARFFQWVVRNHMRSGTDLLSADRLAMADEFLVARVGRKIVGAVCLVLDDGKCAELLTEFVLKDYKGRGIGTRLTRAAIERLVELGRTPIYIDVASKAMDRTLEKLPKRLHRLLRLNKSYLKIGEVELPEQ